MVRASFVWLLGGVLVGGLLLTDRALPGNWRLWLSPTHGHMLSVGWFVQFVVGIAYWLLPRRRTLARPLGYDERLALGAVAALNVGMLVRMLAEPAERGGYAGTGTLVALTASAILQIAAVMKFVAQIWPRVGPRSTRLRSRDSVQAEKRRDNDENEF